jgi:hypothetical protein
MAHRISIRIETSEIETMLSEISHKPATSAQTVLELFTYLRRSTLLEIRGRFSNEEITALALHAKTKKPAWQVMCSVSVYTSDIAEAEKFNSAISIYGVDPNALIDKILNLTSAQVAILQLEIFSFWEHQRKYHEHISLLSRNVSPKEILASRNRQKNPDLEPLIKKLT